MSYLLNYVQTSIMNINQYGDIIGSIAATLTTISFVPQVIKIYKTTQKCTYIIYTNKSS